MSNLNKTSVYFGRNMPKYNPIIPTKPAVKIDANESDYYIYFLKASIIQMLPTFVTFTMLFTAISWYHNSFRTIPMMFFIWFEWLV